MDQPTFADLEYQGKRRKTRLELFLDRMDGLVPLLHGGDTFVILPNRGSEPEPQGRRHVVSPTRAVDAGSCGGTRFGHVL